MKRWTDDIPLAQSGRDFSTERCARKLQLNSYHDHYNKGFGRPRKPIFDKSLDPKVHKTSSLVSEMKTKTLLPYQSVPSVLNDDFCGCENTSVPCTIITQNISQDILRDMKREYEGMETTASLLKKEIDLKQLQKKRAFLTLLPSYYPQVYIAQLRNLAEAAELRNGSNFICLAWIQYHCKFEYFSYFLYQDLEKSLRNHSKFINSINLGLIKYRLTFEELLRQSNRLSFKLELFVREYYQSAGAILIPLSHYAKFLRLLLKKDTKAKSKLLVLFLGKKREEAKILLTYHASNRIAEMREYARFLNWDLFLEQIEQNK